MGSTKITIIKWLFYNYFAITITTSIIVEIMTTQLITNCHHYNGSAILAFTPSYINHHHHHIHHNNRGGREIMRIQDSLFSTNKNNEDYYDKANNNETTKTTQMATTSKSTTTTTTTTTTIQNENSHSHIGRQPKHVGIICDGNSRWAISRNLPTSLGHAEGGRRLIDLIKSLVQEKSKNSNDNGEDKNSVDADNNNNNEHNDVTECVTFYAFSTENWNRSQEEIKNIYTVLELTGQTMLLFDPKVLNCLCIQILGDLDDVRIPTTCRSVMKKLVERTNGNNNSNNNNSNTNSNHKKLTICFGINYGGRRDIMFACQKIVQQVQDGTLTIHEITEETISNNLCTASLQQPQSSSSSATTNTNTNNRLQNLDLIIRTGGENRLSNFMIWESAYSEIYISNIFWPNFTYDDEWSTAMEWYKKRKRNFGGRTLT